MELTMDLTLGKYDYNDRPMLYAREIERVRENWRGREKKENEPNVKLLFAHHTHSTNLNIQTQTTTILAERLRLLALADDDAEVCRDQNITPWPSPIDLFPQYTSLSLLTNHSSTGTSTLASSGVAPLVRG